MYVVYNSSNLDDTNFNNKFYMKRKVHFYEWSDLNRQPIVFNHTEDFEKFCHKSNIIISSNNDFYLTNNRESFITCVSGKPELIISGSLKGLKKNFNKRNKK